MRRRLPVKMLTLVLYRTVEFVAFVILRALRQFHPMIPIFVVFIATNDQAGVRGIGRSSLVRRETMPADNESGNSYILRP
jgi:hypothetical protein